MNALRATVRLSIALAAPTISAALAGDPSPELLKRLHFEPKPGKESEETLIGDATVDPVAGEVVQVTTVHPRIRRM